jgi:hypothetical protein
LRGRVVRLINEALVAALNRLFTVLVVCPGQKIGSRTRHSFVCFFFLASECCCCCLLPSVNRAFQMYSFVVVYCLLVVSSVTRYQLGSNLLGQGFLMLGYFT